MNAIAAARGIYSMTDAARLTGVSSRRIRGWLQGWRQRKGKPAAGPVLRPEHELRDGELAPGFLDFLEAAFLGKLVQAAAGDGLALEVLDALDVVAPGTEDVPLETSAKPA